MVSYESRVARWKSGVESVAVMAATLGAPSPAPAPGDYEEWARERERERLRASPSPPAFSR